MQLHRTTGRSDWADKPSAQHNSWQRLAARTHGVVTLGNTVTLIGFAGVVYGLVLLNGHHYGWGLVALIVGRLCDLLDGWLADLTETKSPLGEAFDVVADKLGVLGTLIVFFALHLAPSWVLVVMLLPHAIITMLTVVAYLGNHPLHPSRIGKYAMAAVWIILAGFVLAHTGPHISQRLMNGLDLAAVLTAAAGFYAAAEYAHGRD